MIDEVLKKANELVASIKAEKDNIAGIESVLKYQRNLSSDESNIKVGHNSEYYTGIRLAKSDIVDGLGLILMKRKDKLQKMINEFEAL